MNLPSSLTESALFGVAAAALGVALIFSGWWLGRLVARRLLLASGPRSLRRMLMARMDTTHARPYLRVVAVLLRFGLIMLAARTAFSVVTLHPAVDGFITRAVPHIEAFAQSLPVIVAFDVAVVLLLTWTLIRAISLVGSLFERLLRGLPERVVVKSPGRLRMITPSTVRRMVGFLDAMVRGGRLLLSLALLVAYLGGVFSLFPFTRSWVGSVLAALWGALRVMLDGFWDYLPNLANLLIIALLARLTLKALRFVSGEVRRGAIEIPGFYADWSVPTYKLVRVLVLSLALVVAFPFLPWSSSPALQGMSVFFGLLISLGSTSFIGNIMAGVVLTYTRGFRVGDRVRIADTQGDVIEKGLLVTRVRTPKNVDVTIPNSLVMSSHMINYSSVTRERHLILNTTVTLGYELPWRMVHETLIKAGLATPGVLSQPRPFVCQTALNDFHVSYELNVATDDPNAMQNIYSALHENIQDACNAAGFEILSPAYEAVRDGSASTVPAAYHPPGHAEPAFRADIGSPKPPAS